MGPFAYPEEAVVPKFVEVAVKATGKKQTIPTHWLDHPVLSEPFRELPSAKAAAGKAKATAKADTNDAPATGDKED